MHLVRAKAGSKKRTERTGANVAALTRFSLSVSLWSPHVTPRVNTCVHTRPDSHIFIADKRLVYAGTRFLGAFGLYKKRRGRANGEERNAGGTGRDDMNARGGTREESFASADALTMCFSLEAFLRS